MTIISKTAEDLGVAPNFADYEQPRAMFDLSIAPDPCAARNPAAAISRMRLSTATPTVPALYKRKIAKCATS